MLPAHDLDRIVLDTVAAHMPAGRLKRVIVEPYINSVQEEGLRITIVTEDDDPKPIGGDVVLDTLLAVSDRLAESGETRTPTLYFATTEELAHSGDPDP
jgi:hypothetical protein